MLKGNLNCLILICKMIKRNKRLITNFLLLFFFLISCQQNCFGNKLFQTILNNTSNIESDDLQLIIDQAAISGDTVTLEKGRTYEIYKQLDIKCSIKGNGAVIVPMMNNSISVLISGENCLIEDLTIKGNKLKMISVDGRKTTFKNCIFINTNYGTLIQVRANECTFVDCKLSNNYSQGLQYAIKNSGNQAINGFRLINSVVDGGIRFVNGEDRASGDFLFAGNQISVNFSHVEQNFKIQHDAVRLSGINNVVFKNNNFVFRNVNRGFKFTDYTSGVKDKILSKRPTSDICFLQNTIVSNSTNGKQLFDLYDGTGVLELKENVIKASGHTVIIEDKTTIPLALQRELTLIDNIISFDHRVLYYRGGSPAKAYISGNEFIYTRKEPKIKLFRIGQKKSIDLKHLFYGRDLQEFIFKYNSIKSLSITDVLPSIYVFNSLNVDNTIITNNDFSGGVFYTGNKDSKFNFTNNHIRNTSLSNLVRVSRNSKNDVNSTSFIIRNNKIDQSLIYLKDFIIQK